MVLNSLHMDPGRRWKGPWRWFDQELLDCCVPLREMQDNGITLQELSSIAACNGAKVQLHTADTCSVDAFRDHIKQVCGSGNRDHAQRLIVGFGRSELDQTGSGHYSPIAAYHPGTDRALVMDVARFKYMPYWAPVEQLFRAMQSLDTDSGTPRGYMMVSQSQRTPASTGMDDDSANCTSCNTTTGQTCGQHQSPSRQATLAGVGASGNQAKSRAFATASAAATSGSTNSDPYSEGSAAVWRDPPVQVTRADELHLCWSGVASTFVDRCFSLLSTRDYTDGAAVGSDSDQNLELQREWLHSRWNSLPLHEVVAALCMDLDASQHQNNQQYPLPGFNSTTQAHGAEGERQGREDAQRWACGQVPLPPASLPCTNSPLLQSARQWARWLCKPLAPATASTLLWPPCYCLDRLRPQV